MIETQDRLQALFPVHYRSGNILILNADCMEVMKHIRDGEFELSCVDPPYGIGQHGGTCRSKFVKQKNGSKIFCSDGGYEKKDWDNFTPDVDYFIELERVSKNRIIWGINYLPILLNGGRIVWDKIKDSSDYSKAEIAYCSMHESIQMVRYMWNGMMQGAAVGSSVQQGSKALNEARIHPTQKPVKLYEWLLTNYAKPGDRILDTHGGSMSSVIASINLGFDITCCELDVDYFAAGVARVKQHQSQGVLFQPELKKEPKNLTLL